MTETMSQNTRAAIILEHINSSAAAGKWVERKRGSEPVALWVIEANTGWSASFDFTSDGDKNEVEAANPLENLNLSFLLDVWFRAEGAKVLSLRWSAPSRTVRVVAMRSGPWEEMFGLPHRDWSPSDLTMLTSRQMVTPMTMGEIAA